MPFQVTKLAFFFLKLSFLTVGIQGILKAQQCIEMTDFKNIETGKINWEQFPEFSLPFELIYGLPIQHDEFRQPLSHGFTKLADQNYLNRVPGNQQAQIYYGTAFANTQQPWEIMRSPWNNDLISYQNKWQNDFKNLAAQAGATDAIESDIFCFDIERIWRFDHEILQIKQHPSIAETYRALSDAEFLKRYKTDMRQLYATALKGILEKNTHTRVASYSDTPIVNTFENIQGKTWQQWQSDKSVLNFLCTDENGNVGGEFYEQLQLATPSAYYYYDYPHVFAGEYLSYLLFQIEANKAWTDKPVLPFVWLRYSFNPNYVDQYIKPWMAEATAIFPFFSGASGLWLWENPALFATEKQFLVYSHFLRGLYRLSQVKHFFEGEHELVMQTSARDYNESRQAIWRGVVKGNKILVAAHNPFAKSDSEEKVIGLSYKNWSGTIALTGFETKLCVFDMAVLGQGTPQTPILTIFPNPTKDRFKMRYISENKDVAKLRILNLNGQILSETEIKLVAGKNEIEVKIPPGNHKQWLIQLQTSNETFTNKLIQN